MPQPGPGSSPWTPLALGHMSRNGAPCEIDAGAHWGPIDHGGGGDRKIRTLDIQLQVNPLILVP